ncbi:WD40-repeat-containing domain protein [Elsinoe ampelina]|uniref:WD40-repeat-containing domain protein n=1 Tax=Elsinoe ampelina TaxID=302913 RepID=A0A6A6FZR2_9PEZI|nr:WD40-repeat-containing domain protein [Elsinoe ampelina]
MAYQQVGGMGGGPPGGPDHVPQGTEYTLQGVMRFLQLEWHSHERARNAWDIERAEMKSKIAKQEGELRHSRRLNEQLERQIKMLELALKNERVRNKDKAADNVALSPAKTPSKATDKDASDNKKDTKVPDPTAILENLVQPELTPEERDQERDKSRKYLEKCMQEIQYLLTPATHAPPQATLPNGQLPGILEPPAAVLQEHYARQRQNMQNAQNNLAAQTEFHNHQNMPVQRGADTMPNSMPNMDHGYGAQENQYAQQIPRVSVSQPEALPRLPNSHPQSNEHSQEKTNQMYDPMSRPVGAEEPQSPARQAEESGGWNFSDPQVVSEQPNVEAPIPRRPDTDAFPSAGALAAKSPPRAGPGSHRRRSSGASNSGRRRSTGSQETHDSGVDVSNRQDPSIFKVKFALRGHLDVVRSVIFTGGGSPSEPEICTTGDDGMIKRWIIPASYGHVQNTHVLNDLDISSYFTHRGHEGIITSLAACPSSSFSTGGRASGDGWILSGGQDATVRVWERGRVDPKATLDGHTDAVWSVCVLPGTCGNVFGQQSSQFGGSDRILLVSGSADGTVKVWAVSAPPHLAAPQQASRRGVGGSRRHSVTSGSNHPSSPQPNTATNTPFNYTLVHSISRNTETLTTPTCICPLSPNGDKFVVSYTDSCILIYDTRTGEEVIGMASNETYDGTLATSINTIVATSTAGHGNEGTNSWSEEQEEPVGAGPTGSAQGVEGVIVSGHEDRYIRFFDANSGQCTYTMLAHPSAISSLSLSPDGHEAVSAGHDASIRFWSLDKRICTQDITSHRPMRGEGVCSVVWSQDGRYVVSAGGDGVVKVFTR